MLFDPADLAGRTNRGDAAAALLLALACLSTGYFMDWFVFGAARFERPDFFAIVVGGALAPALLTLGARRLRDAGHVGWLMLLVLIPAAGWAILAFLWCKPTAEPGQARVVPVGHRRHRCS